MVKTERIALKEIIGTIQEMSFLKAIEEFECQDKDVENFLKLKAVDFDKRNKSRTYLIIDRENLSETVTIFGYYTITMKNLPFSETVSKSMIKRIDGYSNNINSAEAILIGQFGKNYNYRNRINGSEIMDYTMDTVYSIHNLAGCRIVFLECFDNEKVVKFYQESGFLFLQNSGKYLQMIRQL